MTLPGLAGSFHFFAARVVADPLKKVTPLLLFTAENFVAIDAEAVEKILLLRRRFLNKGWERSFECLEFSWMRLKVGVKADEVRGNVHDRTLQIAPERVEASKQSTTNLFCSAFFPIGR